MMPKSEHDHVRFLLVQKFETLGIALDEQHIVSIDKLNVLPLSAVKCSIARSGKSGVNLSYDVYRGCNFTDELANGYGIAVVYDNDFALLAAYR